MTLKVIKPVGFAAPMLVSTTATDTAPAWAQATSYAGGAVVRYNGSLYESLAAANAGNNPETAVDKWVRTGPDNVHAMFDDAISTATTASNSLTVVVATGIINSLSLINLTGSSVTVRVTDGAGGPEVYRQTFSLDGTVITDWYQYHFEGYVQKSELTITDLPPYANARMTITLTGGGTVGIGTAVFGTVYSLGEVLMGTGLGIDDYSKVTTDEFGETTLVRRNSSKRSDMQVLVPRQQMRKVFQIMDSVRATPCVWIPSRLDEDAPLGVFGICSSFRVAIQYATHILMTIELKGMT